MDELRERLNRLEHRFERHENDHLHYFRVALAAMSIAVALVGLAIIFLATRLGTGIR